MLFLPKCPSQNFMLNLLRLQGKLINARYVSAGISPQMCKITVNSTSDKQKESEDTVSLEPSEEPTTCCMSGCANCVWLEYAEKLTKHYKDGGEKSIKEINEKVSDPNIRAYLLFEIRMRSKS